MLNKTVIIDIEIGIRNTFSGSAMLTLLTKILFVPNVNDAITMPVNAEKPCTKEPKIQKYWFSFMLRNGKYKLAKLVKAKSIKNLFG